MNKHFRILFSGSNKLCLLLTSRKPISPIMNVVKKELLGEERKEIYEVQTNYIQTYLKGVL